ncbi:MAG: DsbC family protein [Gammaproteobacteria bacterium]|nr:DsbC family protein [Gammaproteobacteria bacterium]
MTTLKRIAVLWLLLVGCAIAADDHPAIRKALAGVLPGAGPDQILPTPIPGLFEVTFGPQLFYVSEDGRYLIQGNLIDVAARSNLTEARQGELHKAAIDKLGAENMVVFAAAKPKHTVTVFTDIDCGYCRKLHNEVKEANDLGITVRYLFFPRSGPNTDSYYKAETVWCSENRQQALTDAKAGKDLPRKSCANPIDKHMQLVQAFGLQGTPAIVLEDGRVLPGYVPAKQLQAMLEGKMQP